MLSTVMRKWMTDQYAEQKKGNKKSNKFINRYYLLLAPFCEESLENHRKSQLNDELAYCDGSIGVTVLLMQIY